MRVRCGGWRALAAAAVFAGLGCGGQGKPVKFEGLVLLDDKPLAGAAVQFLPAVEGEGQPAVGVTNQDGVFHLTTFAAGDGAVPGNYKVTVTKQAGTDGDTGPPPTPQNREEAKALYIKRARPSAADTSKAKRAPLFPAMYGDAEKTPLRCQVPPPNGKVVLTLPSSGK